ncbi:MAG TPA: penicillin-binding protein 1C [Gemmatimonadaceae bacterium]
MSDGGHARTGARTGARTSARSRWRWGALAVAALLAGGAAWVALPIPAPMLSPAAVASVTLEDRNGLVLRSTRAADGSRAQWMPLSEMDPDVIAAFVSVEDRRYFEHGALDARAIARALRDDIRAGRVVSGASTIAMQTARLLRPARRDALGKLVQVMWALRLSAHLDRQRILELYLNRVQLGQGTVGVPAAAALYFGASARALSAGEAALLAGIAHAPSSDNPLVSPRRARARRSLALRRMRRSGAIGPDAVARAEREPVARAARGAPFLAPHFTTRVLAAIDSAGIGTGDAAAGAWRTSLDLALQHDVEDEVRRTVADLRARGARQAAAVVLDTRTGEVLAWVGSPDFWADTAGQMDMVDAPRQPGSALKPFLYGLAIDRGLTAATVLPDIARSYPTATGPYRPRNYDRRDHGPVRAREALASSYNVPAVEVADRVGVGSFLETLHRAGFASLRHGASYYGLGLALGNGDVTLLELANGYRAIANGGVWRPWTWRAVEEGAPPRGPARRVMSARAAALVLDILSDADARVPGFGLETPLDLPFRAATKTGTSRHFTDNWAVAATAGFTVAVWVGNFSGRPMEGVSGVSGAGPLLHRVALLAALRRAPGTLPSPAGVGDVPVEICRLSGLRAGPECPHVTEWFVPGTEPARSCDWHRDGRVVLPPEYAQWVEQRAREAGRSERLEVAGADSVSPNAAVHGAEPPAARGAERAAAFHITSPLDGDRYEVPPGVDARFATLALRAVGAREGARVRWWVDGRAWRAARIPLERGEHEILARDGAGHRDSVRIVVE